MNRITQDYGPMTPAFVKEEYEIDCLSNCGVHVDRLCEYENLMERYNIAGLNQLEAVLKANSDGWICIRCGRTYIIHKPKKDKHLCYICEREIEGDL